MTEHDKWKTGNYGADQEQDEFTECECGQSSDCYFQGRYYCVDCLIDDNDQKIDDIEAEVLNYEVERSYDVHNEEDNLVELVVTVTSPFVARPFCLYISAEELGGVK